MMAPDTVTFKFYNENPKGHVHEGDCLLRALAGATGLTWYDVVREISSLMIKYVRDDEYCADKLLEKLGFARMKQPKKDDGKKFTAHEFCKTLNSDPRFALADRKIYASVGGHHVVCIRKDSDGRYKVHDTWNSTNGCVNKWWVK